VRKFRITFFLLIVALALSGCGILGGSDGTDVAVAEDVAAQPTVNNVQSVPAQTPADGSLPTAVTLPTGAPTPEPTVDRSQPTTYIVQSGDVLGLIAERFDADIAELRRVNGLDGNLIRVGQELTIPALDAATAATSVPAATAATSVPSPTTAPSGPVTCSSSATGHCVQPGESLLGIALKYDVTVEALRAANPGVSGDLIKSGEVLNLPSGGASPTPDGTAVPTVTVGPLSDADCNAANPQFPYFHAADGLCYANPISATVVPTAVGTGANDTCQPGFFLWEDGLCYPIPGVTVTPTAGPSPESTQVYAYYGTPPCRTGYVVLTTGLCWPDTETTPEVLPRP